VAPLWTVHVLDGVWMVAALALAFVSARLFRILFRPSATYT
jgi:hypothetical protein